MRNAPPPFLDHFDQLLSAFTFVDPRFVLWSRQSPQVLGLDVGGVEHTGRRVQREEKVDAALIRAEQIIVEAHVHHGHMRAHVLGRAACILGQHLAHTGGSVNFVVVQLEDLAQLCADGRLVIDDEDARPRFRSRA
ncbi:MAG: hypothetical protein H6644_12350 [Caldilineaceae bacterium]|nr:hypothetical protein [Caldilineaceae bacterium]